MQTLLVLGTVKVSPSQASDTFVVAPQEESDGEVGKPGEKDVAPKVTALDALRRQLDEEIVCIGGANRAAVFVQINGDEDGQAHDSDADENVSTHIGEAQEYSGVESDLLDQLQLFCLYHWCKPIEDTLTDRRWGVFGIGMS